MIATGLLSALSDDPLQRIVWYLWSCVAFAGILYMLWVPIRGIGDRLGGQMEVVYRKNLVFLTVVWLIYPIVFLIGPQGIGATDALTNVWIILVLDIVAKVVYGYVSTARFKKIPESELHDRTENRFDQS